MFYRNLLLEGDGISGLIEYILGMSIIYSQVINPKKEFKRIDITTGVRYFVKFYTDFLQTIPHDNIHLSFLLDYPLVTLK